MPTHLRFDDNDEDEYALSGSDDEYTENEKELLKKVQSRKDDHSGSEDEVFGVGPGSDDESDLAASDIEGQEDNDDIPNIGAWGKDKRLYYSTDYIDPDYGGFQEKDNALAETEGEEAKTLQNLMIQKMNNDILLKNLLAKDDEVDETETKEGDKEVNILNLSRRQKLEKLQEKSPEFFRLVEDYEVKMRIAIDYLNPMINLSKSSTIEECPALDFVRVYYQLILNYCTNICMYLLLKASKVNVLNHPLAKRLHQYQQLLLEMEGTFEEIMKPQIEIFLQEYSETGEKVPKKKKKTLKVLQKLSKKRANSKSEENDSFGETGLRPTKKVKVSKQVDASDHEVEQVTNAYENEQNNDSDSDDGGEKKEENKETDFGANEKRGITYQMAKNKGLTPYRKKEQRNPRVKHRNKFRKAKIRRKGAVREVRKEISRYGGEISGIKASVTKSIKIK